MVSNFFQSECHVFSLPCPHPWQQPLQRVDPILNQVHQQLRHHGYPRMLKEVHVQPPKPILFHHRSSIHPCMRFSKLNIFIGIRYLDNVDTGTTQNSEIALLACPHTIVTGDKPLQLLDGSLLKKHDNRKPYHPSCVNSFSVASGRCQYSLNTLGPLTCTIPKTLRSPVTSLSNTPDPSFVSAIKRTWTSLRGKPTVP